MVVEHNARFYATFIDVYFCPVVAFL